MSPAATRLAALRHLLKEAGGDGFLVPRTDSYQGEYVAPGDERLAWLTGFTGSAGMAIVLEDKAALFVDGRYTLQAHAQVDPHLYEICSLADDPLGAWIRQRLQRGQTLCYDPWLHTLNDQRRAQKACEAVGASLKPLAQNPIDRLWTDRPSSPSDPIKIHATAYAGIPSAEKRQKIAAGLREKTADAALVTALESLAWLLNIRGNDIPCTPVAQGFAMLWADATVDLFIHPAKISPEIKAHLGADVRLHEATAVEAWISDLQDQTILVDPALAPLALIQRLDKCRLLWEPDPCALPKAVKNPTEIQGAREAHRQDGIAVTRFLAWLSKTAPTGHLTELEAAEKLLSLRQQNPGFKDLSFETISAAGPHGAIVHYRVTPETNRPLVLNSLYLVDSGGQYREGTTDITRTVAVGAPTPDQKDRFTRVLKGHIALAMALFPVGTTGSQLDPFARHALWQAGLDYEHGTGHGVGSYLSVHEGPQRISKAPSTIPLQPGMIISNEPGYYKTDTYGIRIESLVLVVDKGVPEGGERPLLGFETLTLAPIDLALVDKTLLTPDERAWLNTYHAHIRSTLLPYLNADEGAWLQEATQEI